MQHSRSIVDTHSVIFDPNPQDTVVESDKSWSKVFWDIPDDDLPDPDTLGDWMLRIVFNRKSMYERNLYSADLKKLLQKHFGKDLFIVTNGDLYEDIVMVIRIITYQYDNDSEEKDVSDQITDDLFFKMFFENIAKNLTICGVVGIEKAFVTEILRTDCLEDGSFEESQEYIIETDGINISGTLQVNGVDTSRVYCNDPLETLQVLGVEACRQCLLKEVTNVITYDGTYVNYRHLSLLCDVMTYRGTDYVNDKARYQS